MKVAFALAAFAGLAVAQDLTAILALLQSLPQCGQTCIGGAVQNAATYNCGSTDINCLCASSSFGNAVLSCIKSTCSAADAATVTSGVSKICPNAPGVSGSTTASSSSGSSTLTTTSTSTSVTTALTNATTTLTGNLSVTLTTSSGTKSTTATLTGSNTAVSTAVSTGGVHTVAAQLGLAGALGFAALAIF